jgi:hypothetical protein
MIIYENSIIVHLTNGFLSWGGLLYRVERVCYVLRSTYGSI